ncbi:hypothetical protein BAE44_0010633, partial [Dichanthelium oligosanthes]
MEAFVSAVLGDLLSRSISFIIDRCYKQKKGMEDYLPLLRHILLRIQATVEEAEGRHITNQAMLQQLQMLRETMYKGYYLLDTFAYLMLQLQRDNDQVSGHPFALSIFSRAKRLCFSTRRMDVAFQVDRVKEVQKMLESLHSIIDDMTEFIVFLKFYPPISHEPYSKYLFLENYMFGRQAEMEKIISFLLQPDPPGIESLQVLPIIGPPRVGKSTLVEHVCYDERVRNHFSTIILCSGDPTAPEGSGVAKKQTHGSHGRSLILMELADDLVLDERQHRNFFSSRSHMAPRSKVIITSRSENIMKLGTTGAIKLDFLSREAYWYFFKVLAFGSTNPDDHPELASIAMEIAAGLDGCFLSAHVICGFLRANMHSRFWNKILECERNHIERNILIFGEHPRALLRKNQTVYAWSLSNISMRFKVLCRQTHSSLNDVPKIKLHETRTSAKAHGMLEVLVWKSRIPPYHIYSLKCEIEAPQDMVSKKKRPRSHLSEGILKLGTTRALSLKFLPQEAFRYFFKVLAFGSTNPEEHPELALVAMEISEEQDRSFISSNTLGGILISNIDIRFWREILELHRSNVQMHILLFGEHPHRLLQKKQAAYIWSMPNISKCLKARYCQTQSPLDEAPKITLREVQTGSVKTHGEFEVVVWKSGIPPHHSYPMSFDQYPSSSTPATGRRVWRSTYHGCAGCCCASSATVEEAERRYITNQAMLWQLQMLREAMYKGCYLLDTFTYRMLQQKRTNDQVSGHPFALSIYSPDKRLCSSTRRMAVEFQGNGLKELQEMLRSLHSIVDDMAEFIIFLKSYPHISREPYNKYMFLEKCMFGRQAEIDKIISFLLQPEPPGAGSVQVLPITGPPRVGKSTLAEHVCYDERVRNHFSSIILCCGDPTDPLEGNGVVKKQTHGSNGRSLIVMELDDDLVLDERLCRNFYSSRNHVLPGSKVILTSRSENIMKLVTTGAIRLDFFLSQEAYWYFFKVIAFGSTNPDDHPELASIAMEIAEELDRSFLSANLCGGYLRANIDSRFWRKILELERNHVERNILHFGERPQTLLRKNQTAYVWSLSNISMRLKVLYYQTHYPHNEVPTTTLHEVQTRSTETNGRLEVLVWKSLIPPYHSYTMICEMEAPPHMTDKKKRRRSMVGPFQPTMVADVTRGICREMAAMVNTVSALVSAVLGDLISLSISFAVDRCYHHRRCEATVEDNLQLLRRVLLRIRTTVEEAERRRVTNRAMLRQIQQMREGLYRGYYVLSAFKHRLFVAQDKAQDRE